MGDSFTYLAGMSLAVPGILGIALLKLRVIPFFWLVILMMLL